MLIRKSCLNSPYSFWLSVRVSKTGSAKANMNPRVLAINSQNACAVKDLRGICWSTIHLAKRAKTQNFQSFTTIWRGQFRAGCKFDAGYRGQLSQPGRRTPASNCAEG